MNFEALQFLRWNAGLTVLRDTQGAALLLEDRQFLVRDPLLVAILELVESGCTQSELFSRLPSTFDREDVLSALDDLLANHVVAIGHAQYPSRNSAAFWDTTAFDGPKFPICVRSLLPKFGPALETLLRASGVTIDARAEHTVLAVDDYLNPDAIDICGRSSTVLPVKPVGAELWIGPLIEPESICWDCLRYWLQLRRWPEYSVTGIHTGLQSRGFATAGIPSGLTAASGMAASAAVRWSAGAIADLRNELWIFDFREMKQTRHPIFPRARCASCRTVASPEQRREHWVDSRTGILQKLRISDGKIGFTNLAHASVLPPLPKSNSRKPIPPFAADGRGRTQEEAVDRCLSEAIERSCTVFVGDEQHEVHARCLTGSPDRTFPASSVYIGHPEALTSDSNGCAAGESIEQATLHGLLELIERDALAIWWYNRLRRPGLDLASLSDADIWSAQQTLDSHGRSLEILDLTNDLRIPCYVAVSADELGNRIYLGCAADTCAIRAAKRAVSELLQLWHWGVAIPGTRRETVSLSRNNYLIQDGRVHIESKVTASCLATCVEALRMTQIDAYVVDLTRPQFGVPVVRVIAPGLRSYYPDFSPGRIFDVPVKLGWLASASSERDMNPEPCVL